MNKLTIAAALFAGALCAAYMLGKKAGSGKNACMDADDFDDILDDSFEDEDSNAEEKTAADPNEEKTDEA